MLIVLNVALLKTTNTSPTCVQAYDDISNIWGTQIIDFYNRGYATIKNGTFIGKYYKVGIMGHHRVVKFSDEISLKTKEIETYTNNCSVGSLSNLTITNSTSHAIGSKVSVSVSTNVGFSSIIKAKLDLLSIVQIGAEEGMTVQTTIGTETSYWTETITTSTVSYTLNLNNLLPSKDTVRYSKVACYVEAYISESYTEEQVMWWWQRVSGTSRANYYACYYIGDLCTFVYNDNTFGDTVIGEYLVNDTIKEY